MMAGAVLNRVLPVAPAQVGAYAPETPSISELRLGGFARFARDALNLSAVVTAGVVN